jgi:hypothetical protein
MLDERGDSRRSAIARQGAEYRRSVADVCQGLASRGGDLQPVLAADA